MFMNIITSLIAIYVYMPKKFYNHRCCYRLFPNCCYRDPVSWYCYIYWSLMDEMKSCLLLVVLGTPVMLLPDGSVTVNSKVVEIINIVKPQAIELIEYANNVRFLVPPHLPCWSVLICLKYLLDRVNFFLFFAYVYMFLLCSFMFKPLFYTIYHFNHLSLMEQNRCHNETICMHQ